MSDAKGECEILMNAVIPYAEEMLRKHGEFSPFGGAMRPEGEIVFLAGTETARQPSSEELIESMKSDLRAGAETGEYKAGAIVFDVRTDLPNSGGKSDAITIVLDHKDSYSIIVLFPYNLHEGTIEYGEAFAHEGVDDIFID